MAGVGIAGNWRSPELRSVVDLHPMKRVAFEPDPWNPFALDPWNPIVLDPLIPIALDPWNQPRESVSAVRAWVDGLQTEHV